MVRLPSVLRFLGWRMVGVAFLVDFIAVGFYFYSFGIYYPLIRDSLGGSSFQVAMGLSVSNVVGGFAAPFVGRALDRFSIKHMMLVGALAVSAGFALLSRVTELWQYHLVLATCFGLGLGMMGGMASAKLVTNWFVLQRGTALGVATMGVSLSGLVMPSVATWLVGTLGWRGGFQVYSLGILLVVVPLVTGLVVSRPEELGLDPDGDTPALRAARAAAAVERPWRTGEILRSRNFWVIALPFAAVFSSLSAILVHLVPYAQDLGIEGYRAGALLSASAGAGALGKLAFGRLMDRVDARIAVWASFGTQAAGLLWILEGGSFETLLAGGLIFGFGMGGVIPLQSAVTGKAFGRLSFGEAMGLMRPFQVPLHAIGVPLAAWIHDSTASFESAWWIFLLVYALSSVAIGALRVAAPGAARTGEPRLA